jgi:hypothetical protein
MNSTLDFLNKKGLQVTPDNQEVRIEEKYVVLTDIKKEEKK